MATVINYLTGFGNKFSSEALDGALPQGRNSPQRPARGLYPEVLSGSAFTAPRAENLSVWLYRLHPSAMHPPFKKLPARDLRSGPFNEVEVSPNRLRWDPLPISTRPADFVDSLVTLAGSGEPAAQSGLAVHVYRCNRSMRARYF